MGRRTLTAAVNRVNLPAGPVAIPYRFQFRSYQRRLGEHFMPAMVLHNGIWTPAHWLDPSALIVKRNKGVWVCHRGAGKDLTALAGILIPHMLVNPGVYWHVFPEFGQGKKAIWDAQTEDGVPYLSRFPPHLLIGEPNKTEMIVQIKSLVTDPTTGQPYPSTYQIIGGDRLSKYAVGAGPKGIVYSEWPLMDPSAYEYMAPRLAQTGGWVLFIYTPRAKNHGWTYYQEALANPDTWFCEVLTIDQTRKDAPGEAGGPVVPPQAAREMERMLGKELANQELRCSFDGLMEGTIFGDVLYQARRDDRICAVPYEVNLPVGVSLDFGRDGTACWFYQIAAREKRVIDYLAFRGKGIDYLIRKLKHERPYIYGRFILPFDADQDRFVEAKTTREILEEQFPAIVQILDRQSVDNTIAMVRNQFGTCVFDERKCSREQEDGMPSGLDSLGNYRRAKDPKTNDYAGQPVHDLYSHGADAFRYLAQDNFGRPEWVTAAEMAVENQTAVTYFNPFSYGRAGR